MATAALGDKFDELIWIDSDIVFEPDDVERLRGHDLPLVGGLYAKKGVASFAAYFEPGTQALQLGTGGGPCRVRYLGLDFCARSAGSTTTSSARSRCRSATCGSGRRWCPTSCRW